MDLVVVALLTTQDEMSSLKLLAPKNMKDMSPTLETSEEEEKRVNPLSSQQKRKVLHREMMQELLMRKLKLTPGSQTSSSKVSCIAKHVSQVPCT